MPATGVNAAGIAHSVKGALDECGVDSIVGTRAAVGVEEIVASAAAGKHNEGRDVLFDIIVSDLPECVQVSLRDNGAPFDPTSPDVQDEGLAVMMAVASSVRHSQSLGMNLTIIEMR